MFLVAEDFDDYPYTLPNLERVENSFQDFVDFEEENALRKVLGNFLYEEFVAAIAAVTEDPPVPLSERWVKLKDGTDYLYLTKSYKWVGVKKLLKPYIYAKWTIKESDNQNGSGVSVPKTENSTVISSGQRIARGYNDYSRLSGHNYQMRATLFGYLYNSGELYLDVVSDEYKTIQEYLRFNYKDPGLMNMFSL
jgi:hypothetical protein